MPQRYPGRWLEQVCCVGVARFTTGCTEHQMQLIGEDWNPVPCPLPFQQCFAQHSGRSAESSLFPVHVVTGSVYLLLQSANEDDNAKRILLRPRQFEHTFPLDWEVLTREHENAVYIPWPGNAFCSPRLSCWRGA